MVKNRASKITKLGTKKMGTLRTASSSSRSLKRMPVPRQRSAPKRAGKSTTKPTKPTAKRDYKKEYRDYHGKQKQRKRRSLRNQSRSKLVKEGRVSKGDGKDVHHKDHNPANQKASNLRVKSQKANRSENAKKAPKK